MSTDATRSAATSGDDDARPAAARRLTGAARRMREDEGAAVRSKGARRPRREETFGVVGPESAIDAQLVRRHGDKRRTMTLPRPVLPDTVYMITRRCTQRMFLLRPDQTTTQVFLYCLAYAAAKFGVRVCFTIASSNHHHTGIHDPNACYPTFLRELHRLVACCQNARLGRRENFWAAGQTSVVRLLDKGAVLRETVYALTNPVKDHLVARAREWPGASSLPQNLSGRRIKVRKPRAFFASEGLPDEIELEIVRPPGFEDLTQEEFASLLREQIADAEQKAAAERAAKGTRVLGRKTVLRQSFFESPSSFEPRRGLSPRIACADKSARIEALKHLKAWLADYRIAWRKFARGLHDVLFPAGTYAMCRIAGACCVPLPDTG